MLEYNEFNVNSGTTTVTAARRTNIQYTQAIKRVVLQAFMHSDPAPIIVCCPNPNNNKNILMNFTPAIS